MDIIVTIPKSHYDIDSFEDQLIKEFGTEVFWSLPIKPKQLQTNDRIYFVKDNIVESSMRVKHITEGPLQCQLTKKLYTGKCILILDDLQMHKPKEHKGFRGFMYYHH